jgi:hypothetical protein
MIDRSLGWMVVALGLAAFGPDRAFGQGNASAALSAGVTACEFSALASSDDPAGPAIREAPQQDARELDGCRRSRTRIRTRPATDRTASFPNFA